MKALTQFIDEQNRWTSLFNTAPIQFPLSQTQINDLASSIDCKLSPENLHCDGEISLSEANRKGEFLNRALRQLEQYAQKNGMTVPTVWERW